VTKQLHAGYILPAVKRELSKIPSSIDKEDLFHYLSTFEIECDLENNYKIEDSAFNVLNNLISRGLPTFPSIFIEEIFSQIFRVAEKKITDRTREIKFEPTIVLSNNIETIFRSFFIIDPRIDKSTTSNFDLCSWENHPSSENEEKFFNTILPDKFGDFCRQLIEPQREIKTILNLSTNPEDKFNRDLGSSKNEFYKQRVDFTFQFPVASGFKNGLVIEIDGSQHSEQSQKLLDSRRDSIIEKIGWQSTIRVETQEMSNIPLQKTENLRRFLMHPYAQQIKDNSVNAIWSSDWGIEALQIALSPFAIARIHKTLIHLMLSGVLKLESKKWSIVVIERDVPCAIVALEDFKQLFAHFFELEGRGRELPEITLKILNTPEFQHAQLNQISNIKSYPSGFENDFCDVLIDISMLQRSGFSVPSLDVYHHVKCQNKIVIRSCHSIKTCRTILSSRPIIYKIEETEQPKSLVFFLKNIFRKAEFRSGQVAILRRTLTLQNVITRLPTGAGKSLTYQLSALLQPGIVLIVDPLKSLMKDQNDNLKEMGIDATVFINSSIKSPREREERSEKMVQGHYQFVFISPERLQIEEFRSYLNNMKSTFFTYCVVDEAHCVSEWGHDFRTAYLRLGCNARKYCKTLVKHIPIIGLTGTASYDVLADIQRELEFDERDETAIIDPEKYERDELNFEIINVTKPNLPANPSTQKIKSLVATAKQRALIDLVRNLPSNDWDNNLSYENLHQFLNENLEYKNSGIVFCPHVKWVFGVKTIAAELIKEIKELEGKVGIYAGSLNDDQDDPVDLEETQKKFKNDELSLLVATKAFGMGIDKSNIRFTIHFNMPQSIEAFYQEAGRAGRDKNRAYCYILYSPLEISEKVAGKEFNQTVDKSLMYSFFQNSFRGEEKEKRILLELLNEITYPDEYRIDDLNALVHERFDPNIRLNKWFSSKVLNRDGSPKLKRLYVNGESFPKGYGFIDLDTETRNPETKKEKKIVPENEAKELLDEVYHFLLEIKPADDSFLDWITYKNPVPSADGLERKLNEIQLGEGAEVTIGFTSKGFREIAEALGKSDLAWDEALVAEANNYAFDVDDFIENLKKVYKKKTGYEFNFSTDQKIIINNKYKFLRDTSDTFKAIYRLSVIGIIDDYTVDYKSKTIMATLSKKDDSQYIENLMKYIGRYTSIEEKMKIPEEILTFKGDSIVQKCCGYLIHFVYSKIAKKRIEAINAMESAIKTGLNYGNFEEFVNTYFDSKYTPELRNYIYDYSMNIVWSYISNTNGESDSINHLRGACDRLLGENPDNPSFLLLRAFARFLIPSYDKNEAKSDFERGLQIFRNLQKWSRVEYLKNLSKFYQMTVQYDSNLKKLLDYYIANEHKNWIKEFNQSFLKGIYNA